MWWWLASLLAYFGGGWGAALGGFAQAAVAVTSLPGMALFMFKGALQGDLKKAVGLLIWLGTIVFIAVVVAQSYYGFLRIWEEEENGTATGCEGKRFCAGLTERLRNVPAQAAVCEKWTRECKWNSWDRAIMRFTDILPTRADMTENGHYVALLLCAVAAACHACLLLSYRCCGFTTKQKKKKEARDAMQFQQEWVKKGASAVTKTFPVA